MCAMAGVGRGETLYFVDNFRKLLGSAFAEGVGGIAVGTAKITSGEANENAWQARKSAFALQA